MEKEILILIAVLTISRVIRAQVLTFPRCNAASMTMSFVYANPSQVPYDVFAAGKSSTCGRRAGTVTGSGSYADPYVLTVDLSKGVSLQTPNCGAQQIGASSYRLTVRATFAATGTTVNDTDYTVDCDNLILPTTTTPSPSLANRTATYTCQAPSVILFTYSHASLAPPFDIYAVGRETTCSRSANQGTGSGVVGDPYVLRIDVKDPANICGVTMKGTDTYSVVMYVQQLPDIITVADVPFALTCNFTSASSQTISASIRPVTSNIAVREATLDQPTASLYVVSSPGGVVLSSFTVGDDIRLAAQLLDGPATGLRIRQCTVSPGPGLTPTLPLLAANGCSTGLNLVTPFVGQSPSGSQALTGIFDAFKFNNYDTVYFQCLADFCYSASDATCLGSHCSTSGRRKRDLDLFTNNRSISDVITAYVTIRSDVTSNPTGTKSPPISSTTNNCGRPTKTTDIVVVASLSTALAVAAVVCLSLVLRMRYVSSRSPTRQQCRQHHGDVTTQATTSWPHHPVAASCRGGAGVWY